MVQADQSKLHKIIETALQYGYQLSPGALKILVNNEKYNELLRDAIMNTDQGIITETILHSITDDLIPKNTRKAQNELLTRDHATSHGMTATIDSSREPTTSSLDYMALITNSSALKVESFGKTATNVNSDIEIINSYSPEKGVEGIKGFLTLFKSRFEKLRMLMENRPDGRGSIPLSSIVEARGNGSTKIMGMVCEINHTKKGGIILELEDESGKGRCLIPKEVIKTYVPLLDTMILVTGSVKNSLLIAKELAQPDIPTNFRSTYAEFPLFVALLSDFHVGSKAFLKQAFLKFLKFIQGKSTIFPENINQVVPLIKYLLIAGDIVDGVGIYPGQKADLAIPNIRAQYEEAAELISMVPDHIDVIVIPGNHDATRLALPQPPIDKTYVDAFDHLPNVQFLGNPSSLKLNGVKFLINHGRPLDDAIAAVPRASFQNQKEVLLQLLKARHLGPIYGEKTAYAPETRDCLVIEDIPDVWHTGHTHVNEYVAYRGVKVINAGTFQSQTDWQKSVNINPSPGIVPLFNLQNHGIIHLSFL